MANKKGGIASVVSELVRPTAEQLGYILWDVEYVREGADYILRITLDSERGITLDDCERFSRAIDPLLDEADPIADAYHLEVSSPGIERELKTVAHMKACCGMNVEAKLFSPLDGTRTWTGVLLGVDEKENKTVRLQLSNGEEKEIPLAAVSRMRTIYDFTSDS